MKIYDVLKLMLIIACAVTVFQTVFISIFAWFLFSDSTIYARNLYQLPVIGALSTLPTLLYIKRSEPSQLEWIIRRILHFVLTAGVVFGALTHFGWVYAQTQNAIIAFAVFLLVYIASTIVGSVRANRLANQLNERINASHDI